MDSVKKSLPAVIIRLEEKITCDDDFSFFYEYIIDDICVIIARFALNIDLKDKTIALAVFEKM